MKRFITILLALCMLLALAIPVYAEGETSGTCGDGITWEFSGSTLTISGSGKMSDFSEAPWAAYKDSITTVKITGGVTYIGARSFKNYDNLTSVSFGSALYEIGEEAFYDCDGLSSISLPASFKIFGASSFYSCNNLKTIRCDGRFPSFRSNSMWDTYATIYYPADNPWPESTIRELEEAFHGRIQFVDSNGNDHVKETEPKPTEAKPKPTNPPVSTTAPIESTFETVLWIDNTSPTVTRATRPAVTIPEDLEDDDNDGGVSGWIAIVVVVGLLAGFAAVFIQIQQVQQRKRRAARRRRRPTQDGYNQ